MIKTLPTAAIAITGAIWISLVSPALSQDTAESQFGSVHFATSCSETAQRRFDRGMRYQHSFWYGVQGNIRGCTEG